FFQGFKAGLIAFTAAVMGGIGNVRGAVLGGLIIGVIQSLADARMGPQWTEAVGFGYLIAIMVRRPRWLLGAAAREAGCEGGGRARLRGWRGAAQDRLPHRLPPWWNRALAAVVIAIGIVLPFFFPPTSGFINATIIAVAYAVMALGLNIVVGFAGLLDLG